MNYFIVNGYSPSHHPPKVVKNGYEDVTFPPAKTKTIREKSYKEVGFEIPPLGEKTFFKNIKFGKISIYVYGNYEAFILITARSQRKAYFLGNSLRAILTSVYGDSPGENEFGSLFELVEKPKPNMSSQELVELIRNIPEHLIHEENI